MADQNSNSYFKNNSTMKYPTDYDSNSKFIFRLQHWFSSQSCLNTLLEAFYQVGIKLYHFL